MQLETDNGRALKQAWGRHLVRYPWTHFATLTFRQESVQDYARRQFGSFVRRVEREIGGSTYWFYGTEFGNLGRLHLHALLGRTESLPREVLEKLWLCGHSRFRDYDPKIGADKGDGITGAAYYVTKYITKDLADYDVSPGFPAARSLYIGRQRELFGMAPRLSLAPGDRPALAPIHSRRRRK